MTTDITPPTANDLVKVLHQLLAWPVEGDTFLVVPASVRQTIDASAGCSLPSLIGSPESVLLNREQVQKLTADVAAFCLEWSSTALNVDAAATVKGLATRLGHGDGAASWKYLSLYRIAQSLASADAEWCSAWNNLDSSANVEALKTKTATLNALIEPCLAEIAKVTGNSESTIRQSFKPEGDMSVWFSPNANLPPSEFLRNVAYYTSFGTGYWQDQHRREVKDLLLSRVVEEEPVDMVTAAGMVMCGVVPHVRLADADLANSNDNRLSALEQELQRATMLKQYAGDKHTTPGRVSAVNPFAFVTHSAEDEPPVFVFWPKGLARNHVETQQMPQAVETALDNSMPAAS